MIGIAYFQMHDRRLVRVIDGQGAISNQMVDATTNEEVVSSALVVLDGTTPLYISTDVSFDPIQSAVLGATIEQENAVSSTQDTKVDKDIEATDIITSTAVELVIE